MRIKGQKQKVRLIECRQILKQYYGIIKDNSKNDIKIYLNNYSGGKMLLQIFSGASAILGIYLLMAFLFTKESPILKPESTYHLGCYDPDYHNNHSVELSQKIVKMESLVRQNTKLNMYHSKALTPTFDKDVRDVARSFQSYIDHYYKIKGANDEIVNYYNSLHIAKIDFEKCSKDTHLSQQQCLRAWESYKGSFGQVDNLKKALNQLIDTKEKHQVALSSIILKRPTIGQDQIQKNYIIKTKQIRSKIQTGDQNIIQLRASKTKIKSDLTYLDTNLNQLKSILNDCINNQQLIRYCNQLSKQVHRLEEKAPKLTKKQLQSRLQKKILIINGLESNIKKAVRAGQLGDANSQRIELENQKNQLKLLEFQIQNFQSKQEQRCAMCSQERIRQLRKNISQMQARKKQLDKSYIQVETDISVVDTDLSNWNKEIQNAQKERQLSMSSIFCLDEQCKKDQRNSIQDKQKKLNQLKKQIIDKQVQINFLNSGHGGRLNSLKLYLQPINKVIDCLRKREYYEQLKKRAPPKKQVDHKMVEIKKSVIKELNDFEL